MMYRFYVRNWKRDNALPFFFSKEFQSEYWADRYAMRLFMAKNSPYVVHLIVEEV